jgi:hypothetical protein
VPPFAKGAAKGHRAQQKLIRQHQTRPSHTSVRVVLHSHHFAVKASRYVISRTLEEAADNLVPGLARALEGSSILIDEPIRSHMTCEARSPCV